MNHDEFKARAFEVGELDRTLGKQLRSLYVDNGTLQQLVRAIYDLRGDLQESLSKGMMVSDEAIRVAIGLQGQVLGIDTVLDLMLTLMNTTEAKDDEDERNAEPQHRVP